MVKLYYCFKDLATNSVVFVMEACQGGDLRNYRETTEEYMDVDEERAAVQVGLAWGLIAAGTAQVHVGRYHISHVFVGLRGLNVRV